MDLELSVDERQWAEAQPDASVAFLLIRYARMLNTLDLASLEGHLSPWVQYESQSVFDKMTGREALMRYWQRKIAAIRGSGQSVAAELGAFPDGQSCVVVFQASSRKDTNWLDSPGAAMTIKADGVGDAAAFLMITCLPAPDSARRTGIFPGRVEAPAARPKRFVRSAPNFNEITVCVFYLDGSIGLDHSMARSVAELREAIPEVRVIEMNASDQGFGPEAEMLEAFRFVGFPSVGAMYRREIIFRHQGLISGERLIESLRCATPLFVVGQDGTASR